MFSLIVLLLILAAAFVFFGDSEQQAAPKKRREEPDSEEWEYGDVWKGGSPDAPVPEDEVRYVEILRGDTGMGYDDSYMLDLIGYLSSHGIRATYDAVPLAMEFGGAIKTYVLKVEAEKADEAIRYLREKEPGAR
jgi:hypothetical protein